MKTKLAAIFLIMSVFLIIGGVRANKIINTPITRLETDNISIVNVSDRIEKSCERLENIYDMLEEIKEAMEE